MLLASEMTDASKQSSLMPALILVGTTVAALMTASTIAWGGGADETCWPLPEPSCTDSTVQCINLNEEDECFYCDGDGEPEEMCIYHPYDSCIGFGFTDCGKKYRATCYQGRCLLGFYLGASCHLLNCSINP